MYFDAIKVKQFVLVYTKISHNFAESESSMIFWKTLTLRILGNLTMKIELLLPRLKIHPTICGPPDAPWSVAATLSIKVREEQ